MNKPKGKRKEEKKKIVISELYKEKQEIELLVENGKDEKPIARTAHGVICLFDKKVKFPVDVGSTYRCTITGVKEKFLLVVPLEKTIDFSPSVESLNSRELLAEKFKISKLR
jgi:hypothetical protein